MTSIDDALYYVERLARQRRLMRGLQTLAYSSMLGVCMGAMLFYHSSLSLLLVVQVGLLTSLVLVLGIGAMQQFWLVRNEQIADELNTHFPELEHSAHLLVRSRWEWNFIETLQARRIAARLLQLQPRLQHWQGHPSWIAFFVIVALLFGSIAWLPQLACYERSHSQYLLPDTSRAARALPTTPVGLRQLQLRIAPPAYTGRPTATLTTGDAQVPEGSTLTWQLALQSTAKGVSLHLGNREWPCTPVGENLYQAQLVATHSSIYHITVQYATGTSYESQPYVLEVLPDRAPAVRVQAPQQYTEILLGQKPEVQVAALATDDYGLARAELVLTVARGSGEAVKFREVVQPLTLQAGSREATLRSTLNLQQLGMTPGDELYGYVRLYDNRQPQAQISRSETWFVQLEDTAAAQSLSSLSMGVNPIPEYFRSQRQIIIDTEKLIALRGKLPAKKFNEISNEIGIDQKVLRLRYGQFLGEENEAYGVREDVYAIARQKAKEAEEAEEKEHEGHDHHDHAPLPAGHSYDDGHDHGPDPNLPKKSSKVNPYEGLEEFMHMHDTEEKATYFPEAIKAQLKAALAQMWDAELYLRVHEPEKALPYELRALRLLKEVQHKQRVYVRKVGYDPPPLKPLEKRLTGELGSIQHRSVAELQAQQLAFVGIRQAQQLLAMHTGTAVFDAAARATLQLAGTELSALAMEQPLRYVAALRIIREWVGGAQPTAPQITAVQAALYQALPQTLPAPTTGPIAGGLAQRYYHSLR